MYMSNDRLFKGFRLSATTRAALEELTERYQNEAPEFLNVSQRLVIEALISHARRNDLSFSELFGVLEEK